MERPADSMLSELQSSLAVLGPAVPVALDGEWFSSHRHARLDSESGPVVDILDMFWRGTLACPIPFACIAFLRAGDIWTWSKSQPASVTHRIELSVHAYTAHLPHRATFACVVAGARLPSLPISYGTDPASEVTIHTIGHMTGQVGRVAVARNLELYVGMIPGSVLRVGRKRVWHFRKQYAATLPTQFRQAFESGRTGTLEIERDWS
jgi:hypothetical protein